MNHIFYEVLALTRAGITDVPTETDISPEDWYAIIKIAEEQNLISILYRAVRISGLKVPDEILTRIKAGFFQDIRLDRLQNTELTQLFAAFEDQGVDYLPIKGAVMKKYYPGSVYRCMSDADIFIREDQYGIISGIMKNAGYSFLDESEHEFRWKKSGFLIEFHKQAMSYYYADVVDYFGDGFSRAHRIGNSHRYQFDATDEERGGYIKSLLDAKEVIKAKLEQAAKDEHAAIEESLKSEKKAKASEKNLEKADTDTILSVLRQRGIDINKIMPNKEADAEESPTGEE